MARYNLNGSLSGPQIYKDIPQKDIGYNCFIIVNRYHPGFCWSFSPPMQMEQVCRYLDNYGIERMYTRLMGDYSM